MNQRRPNRRRYLLIGLSARSCELHFGCTRPVRCVLLPVADEVFLSEHRYQVVVVHCAGRKSACQISKLGKVCRGTPPSVLTLRQQRRPRRRGGKAGRRPPLLFAPRDVNGEQRRPAVAAWIAEEHKDAAV